MHISREEQRVIVKRGMQSEDKQEESTRETIKRFGCYIFREFLFCVCYSFILEIISDVVARRQLPEQKQKTKNFISKASLFKYMCVCAS